MGTEQQLSLFRSRKLGGATYYTPHGAGGATPDPAVGVEDVPLSEIPGAEERFSEGYSVPLTFNSGQGETSWQSNRAGASWQSTRATYAPGSKEWNYAVGNYARNPQSVGDRSGRPRDESLRESSIGYDPPRKPTLDWRNDVEVDLHDERLTWMTKEGSYVGDARMDHDDWGPYVDTAQISEVYQGRGHSLNMMVDIGEYYGDEGAIHAGSFTRAGKGAFANKGVPTESDLSERAWQHAKVLRRDDETTDRMDAYMLDEQARSDVRFAVQSEQKDALKALRTGLYGPQFPPGRPATQTSLSL